MNENEPSESLSLNRNSSVNDIEISLLALGYLNVSYVLPANIIKFHRSNFSPAILDDTLVFSTKEKVKIDTSPKEISITIGDNLQSHPLISSDESAASPIINSVEKSGYYT